MPRRDVYQQSVIIRIVDRHLVGDGLKMFRDQIDVPIMGIRLPRLYDVPSLFNVFNQTLFRRFLLLQKPQTSRRLVEPL